MADAPKRIQRKREKGWRMPDGAIYVGRPSRWGNPIAWPDSGSVHPATRFACEVVPLWAKECLEPLRGRDLACWCRLCCKHADGLPLGVQCDACEPCHADVLLEIANG